MDKCLKGSCLSRILKGKSVAIGQISEGISIDKYKGSVAIGQLFKGKCCDWTNIEREMFRIDKYGREVLQLDKYRKGSVGLDNYLKGSVAIGQIWKGSVAIGQISEGKCCDWTII